MTHHHHPAGRPHERASVSPSILRLSAAERVLVAAALIIALWTAVFWAVA